jgi:hypothetical protein
LLFYMQKAVCRIHCLTGLLNANKSLSGHRLHTHAREVIIPSSDWQGLLPAKIDVVLLSGGEGAFCSAGRSSAVNCVCRRR